MDRENFKRGSFLKQLRTSNHMTERDLAEILDVETSDIAVWETGIKFPEDSATIEKLAKIFHVTKREILNGEYKKEKTVEVEYKEKESEDYVLSNSGKNILIIVLSCVILLILFVSIISVTSNVNKKVVDKTIYYVSDEREEVIHTPKKYNETIIQNTTALNPNRSYNADVLLNYGFVKKNNKYVYYATKHRIEFIDGKFYLYYNSATYRESYERNIFDSHFILTVYPDSQSVYEDYSFYTDKDCSKYTCKHTDDYLKFINFLTSKVRG